MTKLSYLFLASIFLISCNQGEKKLTPEELNIIYLEKANSYYSKAIEDDEQVIGVLLKKVDSIMPITAMSLEYDMMRPLMNEISRQAEYANKLIDIEKKYDTGGVSSITQFEADKVSELNDSLQRWALRADNLDNKDTIGFKVFFNSEIILSDGSKNKNIPLFVNFDLENDIRKEWDPILGMKK